MHTQHDFRYIDYALTAAFGLIGFHFGDAFGAGVGLLLWSALSIYYVRWASQRGRL